MEINKRIVNNRLPGAGGSTSYYGDTILTSADRLMELFGKPNGRKYEKTEYEWLLEAHEIPFDIYDWKEGDFDSSDKIHFHIAARSGSESTFAYNVLMEKINKSE